MGRRILYLLFAVSTLLAACSSKTKEHHAHMGRRNFNADWKFYLGDEPRAKAADFDDSSWRDLKLPHDWSIEGEFSEAHPATNQGGALPGGIGWYRKSFLLDDDQKDKAIYIDFDGVYRNAEVWINDHYLGKRPYGYSSFRYELSPYLHTDGKPNVLAVRVDNSKQPNSRWYSGSGIYRNVWLVAKNKVAFDHWGIFVTTPQIANGEAVLKQQVAIQNKGGDAKKVQVMLTVYDEAGKEVATKTFDQALKDTLTHAEYQLELQDVTLWSPDKPALYRVNTQIYAGDELLDEEEVPFGIRYFDFDSQKGFRLNGKAMKILGVCMHHDLGALGAAVNVHAMKRQLKLLKEMGANAIRISHNPPAPEFLALCDEMGFLVMDEAFDMWRKKKNKYDYALDFDAWHKEGLEAMVKRDRNHPSVFVWSIGNEIREQFDSTGTVLTKELVDIVKKVDPTRPVTAALTETDPKKNFITQAKALDVLGFNYKHQDYDALPTRFPGQCFLATETASALETRGHYDLGYDSIRFWPASSKEKFVSNGNPDYTVSAYDQVAAYWGTSHEQAWKAVKERDFMAGLFVWSGFDYLGEPVPYPFPARSSYYGIIDLAGFPKDVYYMYQSEWTDKPVLHLFPHWNWKKGQVVDVWAYYSQADEVELFLNGKSLGVKKKGDGQLHVTWKVPFEPGKLTLISRKGDKEVLKKEVQTAGKAAGLRLRSDRDALAPSQEDLAFVTVEVIDKDGNVVPDAMQEIQFSLRGDGEIVGVDNGYQADLSSLKGNKKRAYNGKCLVIVRAGEKSGSLELRAESEGLSASHKQIKVKNDTTSVK